mmetsp:Transcript_84627/g.196759  ORF Transcript_84627/g.196759 Transcript_84627/m.196759 type:complete len:319 (+) Transcript_84627:226-1182(+)
MGLERVLGEEVLELCCMFSEEPAPLLLYDELALGIVLAKPGLVLGLLLALLLIHFPPQVNEPLRLTFVLLHLHPSFVLVHLLDPVVLGKLGEQLLADLLLLRERRTGLLLLHPHLEEIGVLHILPVLQLLPHLDFLAPSSFSLQLLQMQVVTQKLQLLRFLVLGLHLPDHGIQDLLLVQLGLLLLLLKPPLLLSLVTGVSFDPLVLIHFGPLHGLLFGFLLRHELVEYFARLLLLVHPSCLLVGILDGDLVNELLDLISFLQVLGQGLFSLRLFHRYLLLVDVLHTLALLGFLNRQLVLELHVLESFVLHVLCNFLLL